ncbi:MBL fold metallo-hydrolase [Actinomadura logoneensis]|uniref:MBL fold metallo-hydrolase n=1 Tax=Actinomadura logoneensis TaxID=2293572 RepID=A0A372JBH0_9ACTN|nr:MBL fold metallo-hydrolase [Actinomadura logoneensis]RFU37184.1 MBL fold metallo-hydrolase [Actinomadura logoneensis]
MRMPFGRPSLRPYLAHRQPVLTGARASDGGGLRACFLGTSSVFLDDGETSVLCDGFVTRPGLLRVGLGRIAPDRALVRAAIERLGARSLSAVFCAHSHYDHALDAPVWSLETGADLVGSESTANIGRGLGVPSSSLRVVADGDTLAYGRFELTFIDSPHSPGDHFPGTVDAPLVPPARAGAWQTGDAFSVLVAHPSGRILLHASANFRPGMLTGHRADAVYLGIGALGKQPPEFARRYWDEVVGATGARRVVLVHWDDFFTGLHRPLRPMPRFADRVDTALGMILPLAERDGVEVLIPSAWEPTDPLTGTGRPDRHRG